MHFILSSLEQMFSFLVYEARTQPNVASLIRLGEMGGKFEREIDKLRETGERGERGGGKGKREKPRNDNDNEGESLDSFFLSTGKVPTNQLINGKC